MFPGLMVFSSNNMMNAWFVSIFLALVFSPFCIALVLQFLILRLRCQVDGGFPSTYVCLLLLAGACRLLSEPLRMIL
jgi:hypothetical protein